MEKLFQAQQQGGRSEWCEKVASTVPTDEPADQPAAARYVLTFLMNVTD